MEFHKFQLTAILPWTHQPKKETEKHKKITEKKENGEIAKTEVMPEAPKKERKERK